MVTFHVNGAPIGGMAILVAVFSSMGGFLFGYDTGQIADFQAMETFKLAFAECTTPGVAATCEFSNVRTGLIVAMLSIGTLIGALIGASVADALGRKKAIMVDCTILTIGIVIQASAISAWGRIIAGLGVGALSAVVPLYQSEISPKEIRGTLVCTYQLMITFGILIAYCICIGTRGLTQHGAEWRIPNALTIVFALFLGIGIIFCPESPRWLFFQGRHEEAEKSLARTRGVKVEDNDYSVRQTYEDMKMAVESEMARERFRWIDCFQPRDKILYRTVLLGVLQAGQQLTGANYFFYFGAVIFQGVGISDSFVAQIILGAVNFGGLWQCCWLIVYATAGTVKDPVTHPGIGNLEIVATCLFILGYASTWAPGIWTLVGETPRGTARAKTGAIATSCNWIFNFLLAFFSSFITSAIHYAYGYVFAGCILVESAIVFFFLYESAGLSLENVDRMYNDPDCKPWNSHKWVPAGHESRKDYTQGIKAEQKLPNEKPQHRELTDDDEDARSSTEATIIGGTGAEQPDQAKRHGRFGPQMLK
ncbi:hypothetical protein JCM8202v2_003094 [Rhodotorula sphaerocarpa]